MVCTLFISAAFLSFLCQKFMHGEACVALRGGITTDMGMIHKWAAFLFPLR